MSEAKNKTQGGPPMGGPGRGPGHHGRGMMGGKPENTGETIRRLLTYLGKDKVWVIVAVCCAILTSAATLAGSYLLSPIIDGVAETWKETRVPGADVERIVSEGTKALMLGVLLMLCVYMIGVATTYLQQRIMIGVSQRALKAIRKELFDHIQTLPVRYFDTNATGDIMSRFTNDVDVIGEMLNNTIIQLISGALSILGTVVIMLIMNVWLALLTILLVPLMIKSGGSIARRSSKYYRSQQSALGKLNGYIEETVTGQKVVKVFCHEEKAIQEFTDLNEDLKKKQIKAQFFGGIMGPVMSNISQVSYGITACVGGLFCIIGKLSVGNLSVFVNYSEGDGINLSQGQRQLLNIARAAVSKAPILVLDEATSSVDTRTEMHIDHGMERLMKDRTTFVIAHRLSTVRNADCIMVLEQGEIIERGTHKQLLDMKGRYYQLYTGAVELD